MKTRGVMRFVAFEAAEENIGGATLGAALGYLESRKPGEGRGATAR
jgi:hypothetical protein